MRKQIIIFKLQLVMTRKMKMTGRMAAYAAHTRIFLKYAAATTGRICLGCRLSTILELNIVNHMNFHSEARGC